ncbi:hypothetical protein BH11CYA1_BH11CYA1_14560 [soil metagenome]
MNKSKWSRLIYKPALLLLSLSLSLAITSGKCQASDWIDGDVDEIPLNKARTKRPQAPVADENYREERSMQPARMRQMRNNQEQDSDEGEERPVGRNAESSSSGDLTPPAPVLKANSNGSLRITGGVSSATVRAGASKRPNRGLDRMAAEFLQQAPYLDQARVATVQPGLFKAWLERSHPGQSSQFTKTTVIEVKGKWDDCGHILRNFGLPFTKITQDKLVQTDLSASKILVINCGCELSAASIECVRQFVAKGGYLLSTDWALDSCLQKAFPGYVEWNSCYTRDSVVDAVVVDQDPILLAGVPKVAHWKLEDKSQIVKVIRGKSVQVLARSRDLIRDDADQLGILALSFPFGEGRVLHLVGHFDNNANLSFNTALPDPAPIIGIGLRQAIAANFIMAALHGDFTAESASSGENTQVKY